MVFQDKKGGQAAVGTQNLNGSYLLFFFTSIFSTWYSVYKPKNMGQFIWNNCITYISCQIITILNWSIFHEIGTIALYAPNTCHILQCPKFCKHFVHKV